MNKIAALLLLALALPAAAQTYRWLDQNGQVHYTQVPPKSGTYRTLTPPRGPAASPNQDAINEAMKQSIEQAPKDQALAQAQAQEQAQRAARCQQARDGLAQLGDVQPQKLLKTDADGNVTRATEDDVAGRRVEFERSVTDNCR